MSSLPHVPLLGAREVTLGRNLAPLVCYYRIKLPFKAEPVLSGLHTIREHRSFQRLHTLLAIVLAQSQPSPGHSKGDAGGGIQKEVSRLFSHPGKFGSIGKRPLCEEESFCDSGMCRKEEQKARAGSNEREGEAGCCCGVLGFLLSPGMLPLAPLGTLWIEYPAGCHCVQAGQWRAAGTHLTTHLTTPRVQWKLNISRQCEMVRGLASPSSSSLCPWGSQIQGTPLSCELDPQETPQHPKALEDMGFP